MEYTIRTIRNLVPAMLLSIVAACTDNAGIAEERAEGNFCIKATVSDAIMVRGINGTVKSGEYRFSYPAKDGAYTTVPCPFTDGTGLAADAGDGHFLTWEDVAGNPPYRFYLDNVPAANNGGESFYGVQFSDAEKQRYAAGIDNEKATNDIVWGEYSTGSTGSAELPFKLYHRMTRISVVVTASKNNVLDNAQVALTDVVLLPENFNRIKGEVGISDSPKYTLFELRGASSPAWTSESKTETVEGSDATTTSYVYTTGNFIFPPQPLREGANRPRLKITIPKSAGEDAGTYSAVLPAAMTITTGGVTSTQTLSRLSAGQHLTLYVTLLRKDDKPALEFRPAVVERWDYKGNHEVVANKAGIYKPEDMPKLITAYNKMKGKENTSKDWEREVKRYGTYQNDKWTFNLFTHLTFDITAGTTELFCDRKFTFNMHGYAITIKKEDNEKVYEESGLTELIEKLSTPTTR